MRVACVSYDWNYLTYLGRLGRKQRHPNFRKRETALKYANKEIEALSRLEIKAKIWSPIPSHLNTGHVHIVALIEPNQLRRLFPSEVYVQNHRSL